MHVMHSNHQLPSFTERKFDASIFLAGPTLREEHASHEIFRWRKPALEYLKKKKFEGGVFVPEHDDWRTKGDYLDQVEWEYNALHAASVILFWVPRNLTYLPGFTTNVEFGFYLGTRHRLLPFVYGRPPDAPKVSYLDWLYRKMGRGEPHSTLKDTLDAALAAAGPQ